VTVGRPFGGLVCPAFWADGRTCRRRAGARNWRMRGRLSRILLLHRGTSRRRCGRGGRAGWWSVLWLCPCGGPHCRVGLCGEIGDQGVASLSAFWFQFLPLIGIPTSHIHQRFDNFFAL
jgi:hypothetical protein